MPFIMQILKVYIPESVTKLGKDSFETKTIKEIKVADTSPWNKTVKKYACGCYSDQVQLVTINAQASKELEIPCLLKVTDVNNMKNSVFENAENLFYDSTNKFVFKCVEDDELALVAYYGNR